MNAQWNAPISDRFSLLCARVFSPAAAILESEKTLGTRLMNIIIVIVIIIIIIIIIIINYDTCKRKM